MFLIRADGNAKVGAGHLMRCMTVALELAELMGRDDVRFVCADADSAALVRENGFWAYVLHTDYSRMEQEVEEWEKLRGSIDRPRILVDSYFVTDRYLCALRDFGYVALMDDLGERSYPVDCVVNYNAPAEPEHYRALYRGRNVKLIIGSNYVPVRRQFLNAGYQVRDEVRNVLITTGGGDSENIAGKILERVYREDVDFYVTAGRFQPNVRELEQFAESRDNVHICRDVKDMAVLMKNCQLAVTAGGSTVYELAVVGIPFLCFSSAANQEALTEYIGSRRIAEEAGAWHKDPRGTLENIQEKFERLLCDRNLRETVSRSERLMADGRGAARLAEELMR